MSGFLLQAGVFILLAFFTAIFLAAQERWGAIKCLVLGTAFPVTVPIILYFVGRKWWVDRKRVKEYNRQADVTRELNDAYVPKDHVEQSNPNFEDNNPFEAFSPNSENMEIEASSARKWVEPVAESIGKSLADGEGPYICPFHRKYPNVPYSGCTCHK